MGGRGRSGDVEGDTVHMKQQPTHNIISEAQERGRGDVPLIHKSRGGDGDGVAISGYRWGFWGFGAALRGCSHHQRT